jgi:hypothetical protein
MALIKVRFSDLVILDGIVWGMIGMNQLFRFPALHFNNFTNSPDRQITNWCSLSSLRQLIRSPDSQIYRPPVV